VDGVLEEESEKKGSVGAVFCGRVRGWFVTYFYGRMSACSHPGSHAGREMESGDVDCLGENNANRGNEGKQEFFPLAGKIHGGTRWNGIWDRLGQRGQEQSFLFP
jgi:hypothetical protein